MTIVLTALSLVLAYLAYWIFRYTVSGRKNVLGVFGFTKSDGIDHRKLQSKLSKVRPFFFIRSSSTRVYTGSVNNLTVNVFDFLTLHMNAPGYIHSPIFTLIEISDYFSGMEGFCYIYGEESKSGLARSVTKKVYKVDDGLWVYSDSNSVTLDGIRPISKKIIGEFSDLNLVVNDGSLYVFRPNSELKGVYLQQLMNTLEFVTHPSQN